GEHPAGILQRAGRGAAAAQLVRHPARQLELADGRRGDADRGGGAGAEQAQNEDDERERHFRWKQTRVTRRRSTRSTTTRNPSSVINPDVPPNSSTTIARCAGPRWKSRNWLSSVFVSGTYNAGRTRSCQRTVVPATPSTSGTRSFA